MATGSLRDDDMVHGDAMVWGRRARAALADDDVLLGEGLASLLERPGFEVVGPRLGTPRGCWPWFMNTGRSTE